MNNRPASDEAVQIGELSRHGRSKGDQPHLNWKGAFFISLIFCYALVTWQVRGRILQGNSDFIIYYTAARMVLAGHSQSLYDLAQQEQFQKRILQELGSSISFQDGLLPYNHPPFEVLWFLPLAELPYHSAFLLWLGVNLACFGVGTAVLLRSC